MDKLSKLTPGAMLALGGLVLYFIDSFLPWQKACFGGGGVEVCASRNEWHGIGVFAVLLGIVLLLWEAMPLLMARPALGTLHPRLVSMGLAAALVLFTLITTLTHNEYRNFWSWLGLILSIVVAVGVWMQAKGEGVPMLSLGGMGAGGSSAGGSSTPPSAPPPPPAETPPAESPPADSQS